MRLSPKVLARYAPPRKVKRRKTKSEKPGLRLRFQGSVRKDIGEPLKSFGGWLRSRFDFDHSVLVSVIQDVSVKTRKGIDTGACLTPKRPRNNETVRIFLCTGIIKRLEDFYGISGSFVVNNHLLPIFAKEVIRYLDWASGRKTNTRTLDARAGALVRRFLKEKA